MVFTGAAGPYPADEQPGTGTAWTNPGVGVWNPPAFLTISAGDSLVIRCSYTNSSTTGIATGRYVASNEQCKVFGYYFPAGTTSCN